MAKENQLPENDDFFAFYGDESGAQASTEAQRAPRGPGALRRLGSTAMNFVRAQFAPQTGRHALGQGETWDAGTQKRVGQILAEERAYTGKMTMREVSAHDAQRNTVKPVSAVISGRHSVFAEQTAGQAGAQATEVRHAPSADSLVTTWESGAGMTPRGEGAVQMPGAELPAGLYQSANALQESQSADQTMARHAAEHVGAHRAL